MLVNRWRRQWRHLRLLRNRRHLLLLWRHRWLLASSLLRQKWFRTPKLLSLYVIHHWRPLWHKVLCLPMLFHWGRSLGHKVLSLGQLIHRRLSLRYELFRRTVKLLLSMFHHLRGSRWHELFWAIKLLLAMFHHWRPTLHLMWMLKGPRRNWWWWQVHGYRWLHKHLLHSMLDMLDLVARTRATKMCIRLWQGWSPIAFTTIPLPFPRAYTWITSLLVLKVD